MILKCLCSLFILIASIPGIAQGTRTTHFDIKKREQELVAIRKKAIAAIDTNNDAYDSEMLLFKKLLRETLHHKGSLVYPFDSLKKYSDIQTSSDGKIRFYTWMPNWSGHGYFFENFIQFKRKDGSIGLEAQVNNNLDYDICQLHELQVLDKGKVYITFGWGTHGGGGGYTIVDTWKITGAGLKKADVLDTSGLHCAHFVNKEKGKLILFTARGLYFEQSHIVYDSSLKTILFDYYRLSPGGKEMDPFLMRTDKIIKMKFNGHVFRKIDC